jgi:uncharacterized protein YdiU (UPF0061 family)
MFTIGFIGTGKQARGLLNNFKKQAVRIISGAEVDSLKLAKFKALAEKAYAESGGNQTMGGFKDVVDYREILADSAIDGVVIATPDHWHAKQAIDAANEEDYSILIELNELLKNPYSEQPEYSKWYAKRPDWARDKIGCSKLSCSS